MAEVPGQCQSVPIWISEVGVGPLCVRDHLNTTTAQGESSFYHLYGELTLPFPAPLQPVLEPPDLSRDSLIPSLSDFSTHVSGPPTSNTLYNAKAALVIFSPTMKRLQGQRFQHFLAPVLGQEVLP